jgi:hypothetical protein
VHQIVAGDKRPIREIHGVLEFRIQSRDRDREREREIREIKKRIYVREKERSTLRAHKGAYRTCSDKRQRRE